VLIEVEHIVSHDQGGGRRSVELKASVTKWKGGRMDGIPRKSTEKGGGERSSELGDWRRGCGGKRYKVRFNHPKKSKGKREDKSTTRKKTQIKRNDKIYTF